MSGNMFEILIFHELSFTPGGVSENAQTSLV
jgi:hypothetical protein